MATAQPSSATSTDWQNTVPAHPPGPCSPVGSFVATAVIPVNQPVPTFTVEAFAALVATYRIVAYLANFDCCTRSDH